MANDLNKCMLIGRLGQDPESRFTQGGDEVVNMSIAVGKSWKDKQGNKQEKTTWVPVTVFGKLAPICSQYLSKGSRVYIEGEFNVRKWQDQNGNDRWSTDVIAQNMQMLDSRQDGQPSNQSQQNTQQRSQGQQRPSNQPAQQQPPEMDSLEDDIPFNYEAA